MAAVIRCFPFSAATKVELYSASIYEFPSSLDTSFCHKTLNLFLHVTWLTKMISINKYFTPSLIITCLSSRYFHFILRLIALIFMYYNYYFQRWSLMNIEITIMICDYTAYIFIRPSHLKSKMWFQLQSLLCSNW